MCARVPIMPPKEIITTIVQTTLTCMTYVCIVHTMYVYVNDDRRGKRISKNHRFSGNKINISFLRFKLFVKCINLQNIKKSRIMSGFAII